MDSTKRLAIIGLNSLETLGMKSVIRDNSDLSVETFRSFDEFLPLSDCIDAYVVDAMTFVDNLDFFMPRRQKTIVVGRAAMRLSEGSCPLIITDYTDEAEVQAYVKKLLGAVSSVTDMPGELSSREREVLRLIAAGKINKEIADELFISVNTVITHRKNISSKLGIKSASGLSLYAMMNGII